MFFFSNKNNCLLCQDKQTNDGFKLFCVYMSILFIQCTCMFYSHMDKIMFFKRSVNNVIICFIKILILLNLYQPEDITNIQAKCAFIDSINNLKDDVYSK